MLDYRTKDKELRTDYLVKWFGWQLKTYDCDSSLYLLNYVFDRMEFNIEQRLWVAWLYGNSYQLATTWVIANEFPDFENVDSDRLRVWFEKNYNNVKYQSDKKWDKKYFPEMFDCYKSLVLKDSTSQSDYFNAICDDDDPKVNFKKLWKVINDDFFHFGRYGAWFYMQTLKSTCGLNIEPTELFLTHPSSHTQRAAMLYTHALDELVDKKSKIDKSIAKEFEVFACELIDKVKVEFPDTEPDLFMLETSLCSFKKTFRTKRGRYLGYYLDRQFEDIKKVQDCGWDGIDWDLLWQGREEILLPETNLDAGVDKEKMKPFLEGGDFINFEIIFDGI